MSQKEKLVRILKSLVLPCGTGLSQEGAYEMLADQFLQNGVTVLPCKVGDKVKVKTCCGYVVTLPVYEECRNECPFENDCEFDECNDSNEKEFETEITSIFNDGSGWYANLRGLGFEAPIDDFGKGFQVIKGG